MHGSASPHYRLILSVLSTVRKQFYLLKSHGLVTFEMTAEFEEIQQMMLPDCSVSWSEPPVSFCVSQDSSFTDSSTSDSFSQLLDLEMELIRKYLTGCMGPGTYSNLVTAVSLYETSLMASLYTHSSY